MQLTDTRILVTIQIMADDTTAADLVYLLAFVTSLIPTLANAARLVSYLAGWVVDITEATVFTAKVASIIFVSLAFGLGVRL